MRTVAFAIILAPLAACKPPPTDADMRRDMPEAAPTFASEPLPSPDSEGAVWAPSPQEPARIIYGIPGEEALLALECVNAVGELPTLQITRLSPADEGAGALLAIVGNEKAGRVPVDATEIGGRFMWRGGVDAVATEWEPLLGPEEQTVTVPGAGMVTLNPSPLLPLLIESCRAGEPFDPSEIMVTDDSKESEANEGSDAASPAPSPAP